MAKRMTDGWDEIFRAGSCVDSAGRPHSFSTDDLDQIIRKYNDGKPHLAPITIGHPTGKAPAYGWVCQLKRDGEVLLAKYAETDSAFEEAVRAGRFKKKSVGLRDDFGIDHVAYLGAAPPAIKGLKDYQFNASGAEVVSYEFSDQGDDRTLHRLRRILTRLFGEHVPAEPAGHNEYEEEREDMDVKDLVKSVEALTAAQETANKTLATFTEAIKTQGETIATQGKTIAALQTQISSGEEAGARREFEEYLRSPEMRTRITPAMIPGTVEALMLARKSAPVEFEEGGVKKSVTAVDDYKKKLQVLPQVVQFGEFAERDRANEESRSTGDAVATAGKVKEFMDSEAKAGRTVTYSQALLHVEGKGGAQ